VASVAGSDPGMRGGLQTDAWVAKALDCNFSPIVAVETLQDEAGLQDVTLVPVSAVEAGLRSALNEGVGAVKLGALGSRDTVQAVVRVLSDFPATPVIWDPVCAASKTADPSALLLNQAGRDEALSSLLCHLTLATPNLVEFGDGSEWGDCAAVLVTGGHGKEAVVSDRLLRRGAPVLTLQAERTPGGEDVHGTGCALSTAISCFIAQGYSLESAVREAVAKVREWLRTGFFLTR